jgi:hypothetical protein
VDAPDDATAIKKAVGEFEIADPKKRERLVVQRVK